MSEDNPSQAIGEVEVELGIISGFLERLKAHGLKIVLQPAEGAGGEVLRNFSNDSHCGVLTLISPPAASG